ncbi:hypothetical protein HYDPIDRAFT_24389 [Hydnomerulius pinastri MD-312]|nr:hypothetical protein HYDPIDRAFT_24389 [Hydnomerulius pinastri MD-312]
MTYAAGAVRALLTVIVDDDAHAQQPHPRDSVDGSGGGDELDDGDDEGSRNVSTRRFASRECRDRNLPKTEYK